MNTSDELIATEMIFSNVLEGLNPPEAAAILSALVFQVSTEYIAHAVRAGHRNLCIRHNVT